MITPDASTQIKRSGWIDVMQCGAHSVWTLGFSADTGFDTVGPQKCCVHAQTMRLIPVDVTDLEKISKDFADEADKLSGATVRVKNLPSGRARLSLKSN